MRTSPTGIRPTTRYKLPLSPHDRIRHLCCDSTGHFGWLRNWVASTVSIQRLPNGRTTPCPVCLTCPRYSIWKPSAKTYGLSRRVPSSDIIRKSVPGILTAHKTSMSPVYAFRNNASCTGHKKLLYAGGHGGFIAIRTDKPQPEIKPDKIFLTDLRIEDKSMQTDPCEGFSWNSGLIVLPADASRIEFRFSSLTYSSSGNIRMAYRLAGLDRHPYNSEPVYTRLSTTVCLKGPIH